MGGEIRTRGMRRLRKDGHQLLLVDKMYKHYMLRYA